MMNTRDGGGGSNVAGHPRQSGVVRRCPHRHVWRLATNSARVVKNGGCAQVVDACLKSSALWPRVDTMELATNMRALNGDDEAVAFADFMLRVGDGRVPVVAAPDTVEVPEAVRSPAANLDDLVGRVFPEVADKYRDEVWLHERAILAPLNASVDRANDTVLALLPGQTVTYLSVNT